MSGIFSQRVWELAISIPEARVTTYGILARAAQAPGKVHGQAGGSMAARSVSTVLSKAPNQGAIPWHRIVYAGGKVWLTPECEDKRRELYELEGIIVNQKGQIENFEKVVYYFD